MSVNMLWQAPALAAWAPRLQAAAVSFAWVLGLGIVVMLVVVFAYFVVDDSKVRKRDVLKTSILDAVVRANEAKSAKEKAEVAIPGGKALFDRRGIAILSQVFDSLNEEGRATLRNILFNMDASEHISKQLDSDNEDYLIEIIRLVGDLDLVGLDARISSIMYSHKDNVELQYQGFLALSKLGSRDKIVRISMDEGFVQSLSFRSLQQAVKAYSGDKPELYSALLASPDPYIIRICIKRIGVEHVEALAPAVAPFLDNDNFNLVIDAARTLGMLKYLPAAPKIVPLLSDERWEVRAISVTALAGIDCVGYEDDLILALQDREWQVRYNTAQALKDSPNLADIIQKVTGTGDKYALEMLEYMTETKQIWRRAQ